MLRYVVVLIAIGMTVYAFIDCLRTESARVRAMPKLLWLAVIVLLGLIVSTGVYLVVLSRVLMGSTPAALPPVTDLGPRELAAVVPLAVLALALGLLPGPFLRVIEGASQVLARIGP